MYSMSHSHLLTYINLSNHTMHCLYRLLWCTHHLETTFGHSSLVVQVKVIKHSGSHIMEGIIMLCRIKWVAILIWSRYLLSMTVVYLVADFRPQKSSAGVKESHRKTRRQWRLNIINITSKQRSKAMIFMEQWQWLHFRTALCQVRSPFGLQNEF